MNYKKFEGKKISDVARIREDLFQWWHYITYYEDDEGNIIAASPDMNAIEDVTEYCLVTFDNNARHFHKNFAISFARKHDIMEVFDEFMHVNKE